MPLVAVTRAPALRGRQSETRRSPAVLPMPAPDARQWFRRRLLAWYRRHGRALPWRETRDPYRVLVSEIMLQQTQVDRVLPKYHEWLLRYPTFEALAKAQIREVVRTWYPLGYNIRPRRLHAIARESVRRFGGRLPDDEETLRSFKGIGAYTAGAVLSFAFGKRAAIVDTNVARVLFRVFVGKGDARSHAMRAHLWSLSRQVLPHRHVYDFNQALMDFGATVCSARKPLCGGCPMRARCKWGQTGVRPGSDHLERSKPSGGSGLTPV
jgi:A/G-specific adenine glycosylase